MYESQWASLVTRKDVHSPAAEDERKLRFRTQAHLSWWSSGKTTFRMLSLGKLAMPRPWLGRSRAVRLGMRISVSMNLRTLKAQTP